MPFLTHQALQEQLTSSVQEIGHLIDPVSTAARGEAAQLGHKVLLSLFMAASALNLKKRQIYFVYFLYVIYSWR